MAAILKSESFRMSDLNFCAMSVLPVRASSSIGLPEPGSLNMQEDHASLLPLVQNFLHFSSFLTLIRRTVRGIAVAVTTLTFWIWIFPLLLLFSSVWGIVKDLFSIFLTIKIWFLAIWSTPSSYSAIPVSDCSSGQEEQSPSCVRSTTSCLSSLASSCLPWPSSSSIPIEPRDAIWLSESACCPMVVNALLFFRDPVDLAKTREIVYQRLDQHREKLARFFQKPDNSCTNWITDTDFLPERHIYSVNTSATVEQLMDYVGLLCSIPLPMDQPLWEFQIIESLINGDGVGGAAIFRCHHAVADGIVLSGILMSLILEPLSSSVCPFTPPSLTKASSSPFSSVSASASPLNLFTPQKRASFSASTLPLPFPSPISCKAASSISRRSSLEKCSPLSPSSFPASAAINGLEYGRTSQFEPLDSPCPKLSTLSSAFASSSSAFCNLSGSDSSLELTCTSPSSSTVSSSLLSSPSSSSPLSSSFPSSSSSPPLSSSSSTLWSSLMHSKFFSRFWSKSPVVLLHQLLVFAQAKLPGFLVSTALMIYMMGWIELVQEHQLWLPTVVLLPLILFVLFCPQNSSMPLRTFVEGPWVVFLKMSGFKDVNPAHSQNLSGMRLAAVGRSIPMSTIKTVKNFAGCTVNDSAMSILASALQSYLYGETAGVPLRAIVPINMRAKDMEIRVENNFGVLMLDVDMSPSVPLDRMKATATAMNNLKNSTEPLAMYGAMQLVVRLLPSCISRMFVDYAASLCTCIMTNNRSSEQMHALGDNPMVSWVSWAPLRANVGITITILSYANTLRISVLADQVCLPHPEALLDLFDEHLSTLVKQAEASQLEQE